MEYKRICFDIDNVICLTDNKKNYFKSRPIKKNIQIINRAYSKGYYIILYTARYMGRYKGNIKKVNKIVESLEKENDLNNSVESYQELLKLNNIIEKKFHKNFKSIGEETNKKIKEITKKNEKTA